MLIIGTAFFRLFNTQKGNTTLSIDRLSSNKPTIKFDESAYDFGVIGLDAKPNHVFKFINDGQKELVIADVKSSCGCTAALLSQRNIPPGGDGEIKVTFDPRGYRGKIKKTVSVYSNDPNRSVVQLAIKDKDRSYVVVRSSAIMVFQN